MTDALRHYCRNSRCRTKLREPVENEHAAFCCRGCFEQFYRSRCAVCERDLSRDPMTGEAVKLGRKFCGQKCQREHRRFPRVYSVFASGSYTPRSGTPSSISSCDQALDDVRTAEPGSTRNSGVSKSAKVVLVARPDGRSAGQVEAVEPHCGTGKEVGLLGIACALRQQLAGVPEHRIAVGALVDGKVALEHASRGGERIDAGLDIRTPRICQHLRRWGLGLLVEAEATQAHTEATEFDVDVRTGGERLDRRGPDRKDLLVLAGIGADSNRAADVIEHDLRLRKGARE